MCLHGLYIRRPTPYLQWLSQEDFDNCTDAYLDWQLSFGAASAVAWMRYWMDKKRPTTTARHAAMQNSVVDFTLPAASPVPVYITKHKNMRGLLWQESDYSNKDDHQCCCYQQGTMPTEMVERIKRRGDHTLPLEEYKEHII